jgi:hypothetical protein
LVLDGVQKEKGIFCRLVDRLEISTRQVRILGCRDWLRHCLRFDTKFFLIISFLTL